MIRDEKMEVERKRAMYITQFDLSPKTHAILERMEISRVGQLADMERETALKHRNVGVKTLDEIDRLLAQLGLSWKKSEISSKNIKVHIPRTPKSQAEIIESYQKSRKENAKLREEVDSLRKDRFKKNLEKARLEARILELEQRIHRMTVQSISKSTH